MQDADRPKEISESTLTKVWHLTQINSTDFSKFCWLYKAGQYKNVINMVPT